MSCGWNVKCSEVSDEAATQVMTIQYSLNETSRVHDVTMTLIDDVIANNNSLHRAISQVWSTLRVNTESVMQTWIQQGAKKSAYWTDKDKDWTFKDNDEDKTGRKNKDSDLKLGLTSL